MANTPTTQSDQPAFDTGNPLEGTAYSGLSSGASLIGEEEIALLTQVLQKRAINRDWSPECQNMALTFEQEFAAKIGTSYALAVTSGTAALKVALVAAGVGPGDEVICPAWTFIASPGSVVMVGAVPTFAEIDESLAMDPEDLENRVTPHTKAIMPVHLSGVACRMDRIMEIARKHGLKVVEDCAQSCGTIYKGKRVGAWGDLGAFSLQISKVITSGEGGVVTTDDPLLYERAVRYHDQGGFIARNRWPDFETQLDEVVGDNYRVTELTGAVALAQVRKLDGIVARLRGWYLRFKETVEAIDGLRLRDVNDDDGHFGLRWSLVFDDVETRERFEDALRAEGLKPSCPYGRKPIYLRENLMNKRAPSEGLNPWKNPAYKGNIEYREGLCPKTEEILQRALMVAGPNVRYTEEEIERVLTAIKTAAKKAL
jgi:8-amino-3,8-dideoxy-alpha-D-manno-octulosonate transaminase